jgi:hypothetical protein
MTLLMYHLKVSISLVLILGLTLFVYWNGLNGPYMFDDAANIVENTPVLIETLSFQTLITAASAYPGSGGGIMRPISMLSFGLNHYFTGLDPYWFKLTNLLIHCANGLIVFFLVRIWLRVVDPSHDKRTESTQNDWIALATTAAWLLHPINLTSVLYIVQRMTALAAFFSLAGLLLYSLGRMRMITNAKGGLALVSIGLLGGTILAFFSKENGLLLPLLIFVLEWTLFRFVTSKRTERNILLSLFGLTLIPPLLFAMGFVIYNPQWLTSLYTLRQFDLEERLLTESRVVWFYLKMLLFPRESDFSLFHDDIALSSGLMTPWSTLPALAGIFGLLITALLVKSRHPILAFGILFFFAGHSMESTLIPLELIHEHRNYLPGIGVLFVLIYYLFHARIRLKKINPGIFLGTVLVIFFAYTTTARSGNWESLAQLAFVNQQRHPNSSHWHHTLGRTLYVASKSIPDPQKKVTLEDRAREHFSQAATLNPYNRAGHLLALLFVDSATGRAIKPDLVEKISTHLSDEIISSFNATNLHNWTQCLLKENCQAPVSVAIQFVDNVVKNPRTMNKQTAYILASAANLVLNHGHVEKALEYAQKAAELQPNHVQHHLNHAYVLALVGKLKQAEQALSAAKHNDPMDVHNERRQTVEKMLNDARKVFLQHNTSDSQ